MANKKRLNTKEKQNLFTGVAVEIRKRETDVCNNGKIAVAMFDKNGNFLAETYKGAILKNPKIYIGSLIILKDVHIFRTEKVAGNFHIQNSLMHAIYTRFVPGNFTVINSKIMHVNELEQVGGNLKIVDSKVKFVRGLEEVSGDFVAKNSYIKYLDKIKKVDGKVNIENCYFHEISPEFEAILKENNIKTKDYKSEKIAQKFSSSRTEELTK